MINFKKCWMLQKEEKNNNKITQNDKDSCLLFFYRVHSVVQANGE